MMVPKTFVSDTVPLTGANSQVIECQNLMPTGTLLMAPKIVFYARVSTRDQNPDSQIAAARRLAVRDAHIFVEKASGARHDRPVLDKALAALEKGDTLACFK